MGVGQNFWNLKFINSNGMNIHKSQLWLGWTEGARVLTNRFNIGMEAMTHFYIIYVLKMVIFQFAM